MILSLLRFPSLLDSLMTSIPTGSKNAIEAHKRSPCNVISNWSLGLIFTHESVTQTKHDIHEIEVFKSNADKSQSKQNDVANFIEQSYEEYNRRMKYLRVMVFSAWISASSFLVLFRCANNEKHDKNNTYLKEESTKRLLNSHSLFFCWKYDDDQPTLSPMLVKKT